MNHDEAHRHLSASDKRLALLISCSRRYSIEPNSRMRPFDALAESIAYQQLSGKAAATIWKRVRAIFPKRKFLDPKLVLETPDEKLVVAFRSGAPGCLAGTRLWGAQRVRENFRQTKIADAEADGETRTAICAISFYAGVVLLESAG